jgi:hypothetical protein
MTRVKDNLSLFGIESEPTNVLIVVLNNDLGDLGIIRLYRYSNKIVSSLLDHANISVLVAEVETTMTWA